MIAGDTGRIQPGYDPCRIRYVVGSCVASVQRRIMAV
jgi:hypothetical protein